MSIAKTMEYRHYFEPVPLDFTYEDNFKYELVSSPERLKELLADSENKVIAFDTETDGLDFKRNEIVGFSFSFDENSGYYVPLRHCSYEDIKVKVPKLDENNNPVLSKKNIPLMKQAKIREFKDYECNLDVKTCLDIMYSTLVSAKLVLMHNAIFDTRMLAKEGYDVSKINFFDTMCLTYNADTNATGMMGLKPASEHFLGRRPTKFKDVIGKEKTFKYIDPVYCASYASQDTGNTYGLFKKLYPLLRAEGCENILKLDNRLVKSFVDYYVDNPIYIDKKVMKEYRTQILKRKEEIELSIYSAVGYPFNIRSKSRELPEALKSLGLDTGVETDGGSMSTSKDALKNIEHRHPIIKELMELSSLEKQLNSYIDKLAEAEPTEHNPDLGICRIQYKLFGTASGRLASGTGGKSKFEDNDYFINLNIQNLTKPKPAMYKATDLGDVSKGILGYQFDLVDSEYMKNNPDEYYVEGQSPSVNVRKAIRTKDDNELILHLDYNAEEIRLAGIISGEPNFIEPFKHGKDVHTEMAKKLFGQDYDQSKRKSAKVANFGLLYGGNPAVLQAVAKSQGLELTEEESQDLFRKWWNANSILKTWKDIELDKAFSNNLTVKDMFGRPRRLKHYLTSDERGIYNFGVRTIASHKVQGSGSSIMRELLVKLEKNIYNNPKYSKRVRYISSVHDEVNSAIEKKNFTQWTKVIEDIMTYNPKSFPIPIDCGIEVGTSLGELFPFEWSDGNRTKLIPSRS